MCADNPRGLARDGVCPAAWRTSSLGIFFKSFSGAAIQKIALLTAVTRSTSACKSYTVETQFHYWQCNIHKDVLFVCVSAIQFTSIVTTLPCSHMYSNGRATEMLGVCTFWSDDWYLRYCYCSLLYSVKYSRLLHWRHPTPFVKC